MTKALTEQWREGTLPDAEYYVKNKGNVVVVDYYCELTKSFASVFPCNVKEVLAPVPSYDEIKRLQERLKIATKALKEINKNYRFTVAQDVVYKALEEIEGVK